MGVQINGDTGNVSATKGTYSSNLTVGGVLTFEDVTNVDSIGIVTARTDINLGDSIIHIDDTNTKIRFPAADTITAETGGGERLRIASDGKTGIGTNNPVNKFHVVNSDYQVARFESSSATDNGTYLELYANSPTPADDDILGIINFKGNNDGASNSNVLEETAFAQVRGYAGDVTDASEDGYLTFNTRAAGTFAERVRITSDGNIGVGVQSPSAKLHVQTGATGTIAQFRGDSTDLLNIDGDSNQITLDARNVGALAFEMQGSESMRIGSSNEIHIGTSSWPTGSIGKSAGRVMIGNEGSVTIWNETHSAGGGGTLKLACKAGNDATRIGFANLIAGPENSSDYASFFKIQVANSGGSGIERLKINSSGNITTPHQFHIEVRRTNDQTGYNVHTDFGVPMIFTDVVTTRGTTNSALDTSTGKITVPVDGVYYLEASVFTSTGNYFNQAWFTEGSSRMSYSDWTLASAASKVQASGMHYLSAGTEVGFHPYGQTSTTVTLNDSNNHTWFRVTLMG